MDKRTKALTDALTKAGWRMEPTKAGLMAYSPDGVAKVSIHLTPSDHRAWKNMLSRLRAGGFETKGW